MKRTNINSFNIDTSGYSKFKNKLSFKEIITQNFRYNDLIVLNNFNDNLFFKKKLLNKLLSVIGLPIGIDVENSNKYTLDRISQNSSLSLKTNVSNSSKFLYKKIIKNSFIKNLNIRSLNENLIQRSNLFSKRKFRRKIHELMYFDNNKKTIVKKQLFKQLFLNMSNKIERVSLSNVIYSLNYNNNARKETFLNSRISENNLLNMDVIFLKHRTNNGIRLSLSNRSFKRYLFKLKYNF